MPHHPHWAEICGWLEEGEVQVGSERFEALIGFSKRLKVGFNILGREPFFGKFRVCFDDAKRVVSFE